MLDINRSLLDPAVFEMPEEGHPKLNNGIKGQIIQTIRELEKTIPVHSFYIVGSILTNRYNNNSDIDVNIQLDPSDLDSIALEDILMFVKHSNGKLAAGTTHPINYYIIKGEFDFDNADGVYDVANERWLKLPRPLDVDVKMYMSRFESDIDDMVHSTEEIRKDVVDLEDLKSIPRSRLQGIKEEMEKKLANITQEAETLISMYKNIKQIRKLAFDKYMTPSEIKEIGSKVNLPENIVYKFLQRYYYEAFVKSLENIMGTKDRFGANDIDRIKRAGRNLWK